MLKIWKALILLFNGAHYGGFSLPNEMPQAKCDAAKNKQKNRR